VGDSRSTAQLLLASSLHRYPSWARLNHFTRHPPLISLSSIFILALQHLDLLSGLFHSGFYARFVCFMPCQSSSLCWRILTVFSGNYKLWSVALMLHYPFFCEMSFRYKHSCGRVCKMWCVCVCEALSAAVNTDGEMICVRNCH